MQLVSAASFDTPGHRQVALGRVGSLENEPLLRGRRRRCHVRHRPCQRGLPACQLRRWERSRTASGLDRPSLGPRGSAREGRAPWGPAPLVDAEPVRFGSAGMAAVVPGRSVSYPEPQRVRPGQDIRCRSESCVRVCAAIHAGVLVLMVTTVWIAGSFGSVKPGDVPRRNRGAPRWTSPSSGRTMSIWSLARETRR